MRINVWALVQLLITSCTIRRVWSKCNYERETSDNICPKGFWTVNSRPYNCLRFGLYRLSWEKAQKYCESKGGSLMKPYFHELKSQFYRMNDLGHHVGMWMALTKKSNGEWTWLDETTEAAFIPWAAPPTNRDEKCVAMDVDLGEYRGKHCKGLAFTLCEQPKEVDKDCAEDWNPLPSSPWCVKEIRRATEYHAAIVACNSFGATVVTIKDQAKYDAVKAYWSVRENIWLGISDREKEGVFKWVNSGKAVDHQVQADGGRAENCVAVGKDQDVRFDDDCKKYYRFFCQRASKLGHGVMTIELNARFTEPQTHIFFKGDWVISTCKAVRAGGNQIFWGFIGPNDARVTPVGDKWRDFTTTFTDTKRVGSQCQPVTESTFSTQGNQNMNATYLACYAGGSTVVRSWCTGSGDTVEFCRKTRQIKIVGGPLKTPNMVVQFHKPPNVLIRNHYLQAKCTTYPGDGGSLVWVFYTGQGARALNHNRDREVVSQNTYRHVGSDTVIESFLKFKVYDSLDGAKIACFAYDISKAGDLTCKRTDKFCNMTDAITVIPGFTLGNCFMFPNPCFIVSVLIVIVIIVVLAYPSCKTPQDVTGAEDKGENGAGGWNDPYYVDEVEGGPRRPVKTTDSRSTVRSSLESSKSSKSSGESKEEDVLQLKK